jgi:hypothetical protein
MFSVNKARRLISSASASIEAVSLDDNAVINFIVSNQKHFTNNAKSFNPEQFAAQFNTTVEFAKAVREFLSLSQQMEQFLATVRREAKPVIFNINYQEQGGPL